MGLFSKRIEKQIESYQHELIETHYREVDNMYRQIRGWRHDYRNHIQTMKAYAATENWEAIKNYLDLLDEDLTTVDTVIKTGNPMTDAILNSKISLAKSKGIAVVADAHIPVKLKSSEIDLCCIIGNLFDNAIEASVKLPEEQRLIREYMKMELTFRAVKHRKSPLPVRFIRMHRLLSSTSRPQHLTRLRKRRSIQSSMRSQVIKRLSISLTVCPLANSAMKSLYSTRVL